MKKTRYTLLTLLILLCALFLTACGNLFGGGPEDNGSSSVPRTEESETIAARKEYTEKFLESAKTVRAFRMEINGAVYVYANGYQIFNLSEAYQLDYMNTYTDMSPLLSGIPLPMFGTDMAYFRDDASFCIGAENINTQTNYRRVSEEEFGYDFVSLYDILGLDHARFVYDVAPYGAVRSDAYASVYYTTDESVPLDISSYDSDGFKRIFVQMAFTGEDVYISIETGDGDILSLSIVLGDCEYTKEYGRGRYAELCEQYFGNNGGYDDSRISDALTVTHLAKALRGEETIHGYCIDFFEIGETLIYSGDDYYMQFYEYKNNRWYDYFGVPCGDEVSRQMEIRRNILLKLSDPDNLWISGDRIILQMESLSDEEREVYEAEGYSELPQCFPGKSDDDFIRSHEKALTVLPQGEGAFRTDSGRLGFLADTAVSDGNNVYILGADGHYYNVVGATEDLHPESPVKTLVRMPDDFITDLKNGMKLLFSPEKYTRLSDEELERLNRYGNYYHTAYRTESGTLVLINGRPWDGEESFHVFFSDLGTLEKVTVSDITAQDSVYKDYKTVENCYTKLLDLLAGHGVYAVSDGVYTRYMADGKTLAVSLSSASGTSYIGDGCFYVADGNGGYYRYSRNLSGYKLYVSTLPSFADCTEPEEKMSALKNGKYSLIYANNEFIFRDKNGATFCTIGERDGYIYVDDWRYTADAQPEYDKNAKIAKDAATLLAEIKALRSFTFTENDGTPFFVYPTGVKHGEEVYLAAGDDLYVAYIMTLKNHIIDWKTEEHTANELGLIIVSDWEYLFEKCLTEGEWLDNDGGYKFSYNGRLTQNANGSVTIGITADGTYTVTLAYTEYGKSVNKEYTLSATEEKILSAPEFPDYLTRFYMSMLAYGYEMTWVATNADDPRVVTLVDRVTEDGKTYYRATDTLESTSVGYYTEPNGTMYYVYMETSIADYVVRMKVGESEIGSYRFQNSDIYEDIFDSTAYTYDEETDTYIRTSDITIEKWITYENITLRDVRLTVGEGDVITVTGVIYLSDGTRGNDATITICNVGCATVTIPQNFVG